MTQVRSDCPDPDGGGFNPCAGQPGGNYIYVDHGSGFQTRYHHLAHSGFNAYVGQTVARGQQMALSDNSGPSTGPHLDFELLVSGTKVDPYAGATHWAGADPFPMGYRDQNNTIQGPFRLDDATIRDKWVTAAAQLGSPIADDCVLAGSCPPAWPGTPACLEAGQLPSYQQTVQRFERGYIYYCSNGVAFARHYFYTYLPRLQATANGSDWDAYVYIRNLTASPATVSITLLKTDGKALDSRVRQALPGNATWQIRPATIINDWLIGGYNSFIGSAIVASDRDVAVVVVHGKSNRLTAYTGVSSLNAGTGWGLPASTLYVPAEPNVPSGFYGSVKVTCTASAAAGIHNIARLRDQQGNTTPGDFGASYNMIQR